MKCPARWLVPFFGQLKTSLVAKTLSPHGLNTGHSLALWGQQLNRQIQKKETILHSMWSEDLKIWNLCSALLTLYLVASGNPLFNLFNQ